MFIGGSWILASGSPPVKQFTNCDDDSHVTKLIQKDPPIRVLRAFVVDWARLYHEGAKSQVSGCVFAALPVFIRGGEARDYGNSVVKEDPIMV